MDIKISKASILLIKNSDVENEFFIHSNKAQYVF